MDARLLDMLVCPVTKASLVYQAEHQELWCRMSRLAYPIRDGFPVMIESEARALSDAEAQSLPT